MFAKHHISVNNRHCLQPLKQFSCCTVYILQNCVLCFYFKGFVTEWKSLQQFSYSPPTGSISFSSDRT